LLACHRVSEKGAAVEAVAVAPEESDHEVAGVARVQDLGTEVRKDREQVSPPVADAGVAVVGVNLQRLELRDRFHLGVLEREEGVEITPVERVKGAMGPLHVLL
jgi:hypothetical protein